MAKIKTWVVGISGKTGRFIPEAIANSQDFELQGGSGRVFAGTTEAVSLKALSNALQECDAIIDFSTQEANELLLASIEQSNIKQMKILIATTSLSEDLLRRWKSLSQKNELSIAHVANTSLGVLLLLKSLQSMSSIFHKSGFDIDVSEWHHRHKKDSPGGTTKQIIKTINSNLKTPLKIKDLVNGPRGEGEIGVQVFRSGNVFGEHTVSFTSDIEQLSVTHRAFDRRLFANGSLNLMRWLFKQKIGFYTLDDIELKDL